MRNELRVGLIGFGYIGKVHANALENLKYYYHDCGFTVRIVRVCTSSETTAQAAAELIGGGCEAVTDYRKITEADDIDIVDIATPNDLHFEALKDAIAHQKHIYCEKPLVSTMAEAEAIAALLPGYTGISQLALQYRFSPPILRAKRIIDSGRLGKILEFRTEFKHAGSAKAETVIKQWKLGAGVIADLGSHVLDLTRFLLGEAQWLSATRKTAYPTRPDGKGGMVNVPTEDNMLALVHLKNDADGLVAASKLNTGAEDELLFEINGSDGALKFNGMDPHHLYFYDNTLPDSPIGGMKGWTRIDCGHRYEAPANGFPGAKASIGWIRSHIHSMWNFVNCVTNNTPAHPDLADGVQLQKLMDAVIKAADSGNRITVVP